MRTPEEIDGFADNGWVTTCGGHVERHHPRLSKKDRALYDQAKRDRYLTSGSHELRDLWFSYSEARQWPYIIVCLRTRYATITCDFIATPDRKAEGIFERTWQVIQSHADTLLKKKTRLSGGDIRFTIDKIPNSIAAPLANEIADMCFAC